VQKHIEDVVEALVDDEIVVLELVDDLAVADDAARGPDAANDQAVLRHEDAAIGRSIVHAHPPLANARIISAST
jgi:hypothetical protein